MSSEAKEFPTSTNGGQDDTGSGDEDLIMGSIPSTYSYIRQEELDKLEELTMGSSTSAAPCQGSSTSDREPDVCDKSSKPKHVVVNHSTKMSQKSLEELQMELCAVSIQNERKRFNLIQEQTALCKELRENIPYISTVLDAYVHTLLTKTNEK